MSGILRQRTTMAVGTTFDATTRSSNNDRTNQSFKNTSSGLTVAALENANPQQTGYVDKLHIPILYMILPTAIQKLLYRIVRIVPILKWMIPQWKRRYLILVGSYLYKFDSNYNPNSEPKGSPIPIENLEIQLLTDGIASTVINDDDDNNSSPRTTTKVLFSISNLQKTTYFGCSSVEDGQIWVESLRQARQEVIRRSMGHTPIGSYPPKWDYYDTLGRSLYEQKQRIHKKLQQHQKYEMEMISEMGSGSGIGGGISSGYTTPQGYYG